MSKLSPSSAPGSEAASMPMVSVVIPVRNEASNLGALLEDLLKQDYPAERYEILVADGESTDRTKEVVEDYALKSPVRIICLPNPRRLSSAGRNVGVTGSRGDIVCFIDGHCSIPTIHLLHEMARLFQETGAVCLCRPQPLTFDGNTFMQDLIAHARSTALGHGSDSTIYSLDREGYVNPTSSGAVYLRSIFERVGLYDERFDACEDVEFNFRVHQSGLRSYLSPAIAVYYRPRASFAGLFKQLVRYGRGRVRFIRKHPEAFSVSQLIPALFLSGLLAGGTLSFFSTPIRYVYFGVLALYAIVVLFFSARLGFRFGWRHSCLAPMVYITIHLALGAGSWAEAASSFWTKPAAKSESLPIRPAVEGPVRRSSNGEE